MSKLNAEELEFARREHDRLRHRYRELYARYTAGERHLAYAITKLEEQIAGLVQRLLAK
jgi:hypothetical protein